MTALHTFEGSLWNGDTMIRETYAQHFRSIENTEQLRATLRAGEYAFPGGYQLALITSDGALLCFDCARNEYANISWSIRNECGDGWRVTGATVMHDGESDCDETCAHCNKTLAHASDCGL